MDEGGDGEMRRGRICVRNEALNCGLAVSLHTPGFLGVVMVLREELIIV